MYVNSVIFSPDVSQVNPFSNELQSLKLYNCAHWGVYALGSVGLLSLFTAARNDSGCLFTSISFGKGAFTRASFVCRFMSATELGERSNERRST